MIFVCILGSMRLLARLNSADRSQKFGLASGVFTVIYLVWLSLSVHSLIGYVFLFFEIAVGLFTILVVFNHWHRKYELIGGSYSLRTPVDVFVPVVNEPLDIIQKTIAAASAINHPNINVYVLDDGNRKAVEAFAKKYGCYYLSRPDNNVKAKQYKACNLNYGLAHSYAPYILVIDADNVVKPDILDDLLGHFF